MEPENPELIKALLHQTKVTKINRREFLRTGSLLGLTSIAAYQGLGLMDLGFTGTAVAQELPKGGHLRIGTRIHPVRTPHQNDVAEASNVIRATCEYLTRTGQDNVTRPYLLERWETSDDLRTWTLHLRRDVKWRKGRKFVADDVIWNIKNVLDPKIGSSMLGLFKPFLLSDDASQLWDPSAIEKVDDQTVRLNLRQPQLAMAEHFFNHPMAIVDPEEGGIFKPGMNGTGPFELVEYEPKRRALFKANKDYWGPAPHLDTLEYIDLGDDPATALAALRSGQVDGLNLVDVSSLPIFEKFGDMQVYEVATAETAVARMRVDQKPFDDPRVRKAMKLAIDQRHVLAVALGGRGEVAEHHFVSPIHPEYTPLPLMTRDVAQARKLLAESGLPNGFETELVVSQQPGWLIPAANSMANQWAEAGIRVKVQPVPSSLYNEKWKEVPFGFTRWGHRPLAIMTLAVSLRSNVPWNESGYNNERFDELIAQAEATLDLDERKKVVAQIEELLQEDGPFVQPLWRKLYTVHSKRVKGFRMHPTAYIFPEELAIERA
jgi:peptide/nickel transport system substrate-binding protein